MALPDLKGGKYSVLGDLYSIFAMEKCEHQQIEVISALVKIMKQQTNKRLLQIESCFRQHNYIVWNVIEHLDRELIRPYLESSEDRPVKAALVAMGNLAGEKEELVYWKYLLDRRITVSKQAYLVIRKLHIRYGVVQLYELYCERSNQDTSRYFLKLLLEEPSWKRLPYLLKLYNIKDVDMRDRVRKCIYVRNMYATVTEEQEQTIRSVLEEVREEIPESLRKNIILDLKYVCRNR